MIVDDHPMWRDTLRTVLEHAGVGRIVAEAGDGDEAIAIAAEVLPDVIIMDINLPTVNGIDATRALIEAHPGVKVIALTSSDEPEHILEIVRSGANGHLLKTATSQEVADAVRRVWSGEAVFPAASSDVVLGEFRRLSTMAAAAVTLVVGDPVALHRDGLASLLGAAGFEVAGTAGSPDQVDRLCAAHAPDALILDVGLASTSIEDTTLVRHLRSRHERLGILLMSSAHQDEAAFASLDLGGGWGLVRREHIEDVEQLSDSIARVIRGESVVDRDIVDDMVTRARTPSAIANLTARERQVLALMAEGRSNQAIGERLFLGSKTIEAHVRSIFSKLGLEPARDDQRRVLAVLEFLRSS